MATVNRTYRIQYQYCAFLKVVHKDLTVEKFLNCACLKNGFARDMFTKVYNSVMAEAENLENLYERYYKQEYDSFKDFIGAKFAIPQKSLDALMNGLSEKEDYTLIRYDSLDYGATGVADFIYGEEYDDMFERLFLLDL